MHHHDTLFSCESATKGNRPVCLDVCARLLVGLAGIVAVLISSRPWFGSSAFAGCLLGMVFLRTLTKSFFRRFIGPVAFAVFLGLFRTFITGTTPLISFSLGSWLLTATREGFAGGILMASRVLGAVGIVFLVCEGLPAHKLFAAIRWAKMPATWVEIALLMYRYLYLFLEQAASVVAAQKVRLGYHGFRRSLQSMASLTGVILLRSLDQAEKSHEAMVARGYQGFMPLSSLPPFTWQQMTLAGLGVSSITALFFLAERGLT